MEGLCAAAGSLVQDAATTILPGAFCARGALHLPAQRSRTAPPVLPVLPVLPALPALPALLRRHPLTDQRLLSLAPSGDNAR
jgi:hypothetical protein